jgi:hypothetical protein
MASLSASDILRIWEAASSQDPLTRALTILAAHPNGLAPDALADLGVGERDRRLYAIREQTFGPTLHGVTPCPHCEASVEFALEIPALRAKVSTAPEPAESTFVMEKWRVRYRLPTSLDLATVARADDVDASRILAERCVLAAERDGAHVTPAELPPEVLSRLARSMADLDPMAEVFLDFVCPSCGHAGRTLLDIAGYLWDEIRAEARRLLREVHVLARAYGWREADILALSAARRRAYLEMA